MQTLDVSLQPIDFVEAQPDDSTLLLAFPAAGLQIVHAPDLIEDSWHTDRETVGPVLSQNADGLWSLSLHRQGEYGKFDKMYIGSEIILASPDLGLVVALIAYHGTEAYGTKRNRHVAKGQFYRYYQQLPSGDWQQIVWQKIGDNLRQLIIETVIEKGPAWARKPGKLSSERNPPASPVITTSYKVVRLINGRYFSIYDPKQEYVLGERVKQAAKPGHGGGFFSYPTLDDGMDYLESCTWSLPYHQEVKTDALVLLECTIGGRIINYGHKLASTYLQPVKVIEVRSISCEQ